MDGMVSTIRILLINPPNAISNKTIGKIDEAMLPSPPFGLLGIAAVLLENGLNCSFLDAGAERFDVEDTIRHTREVNPDIIGIPIVTSNACITSALLTRIRSEFRNAKIVLGHIHASIFSDYYLKNNLCDIVAHGEAEFIMLDICKTIADNGDLANVKGISFNTHQGIVNTGLAPLIHDLDSLPFPARQLAPMHKYEQQINHAGGTGTFHIISSRGCPIGCNFCCSHSGKTVRARSAERVLEEVALLVKDYGAKDIFFLDPMFLADRERVFAICDGLKNRFPGITWKCEAHVNFINEKILAKLKEAGCLVLFYGIETANDSLLKSIGKKVTIDKIIEKVYLTRKYGIKIHGFFLLGIPGETTEMSWKTINLALKLPLESAFFSIYTPLPGSDIFEIFRKEKIIDPYDWEKFNPYSGYAQLDPIYVPAGRTAGEIKALQRKAVRLFFFRPHIMFKLFIRLNPRNLVAAYKACKLVIFSR